jgi:hypothetical protein
MARDEIMGIEKIEDNMGSISAIHPTTLRLCSVQAGLRACPECNEGMSGCLSSISVVSLKIISIT